MAGLGSYRGGDDDDDDDDGDDDDDDEMSVSLVEETRAPGGIRQPMASKSQTFTHAPCAKSQDRTRPQRCEAR